MNANGTKDNPVEKMATESSARLEHMFDEFQKFQETQHKRYVEMIDESARMMKASVEYGVKVTDEIRKMALQANKQATELLTTKWF